VSKLKVRIFKIELGILTALDFDIVFIHPYRYLAYYIIKMHLDRSAAHNAWDLIGDMIPLPEIILRFQPAVIAATALFISSCLCQHRLDKDWLKLFNSRSPRRGGMDIVKEEVDDEESYDIFDEDDEEFNNCRVTVEDVNSVMKIYFNALKYCKNN
jgi:hypothetical protein